VGKVHPLGKGEAQEKKGKEFQTDKKQQKRLGAHSSIRPKKPEVTRTEKKVRQSRPLRGKKKKTAAQGVPSESVVVGDHPQSSTQKKVVDGSGPGRRDFSGRVFLLKASD